MLEKGDFVHYKIMVDDVDGKPTNEILHEGEGQITGFYHNGNLKIDGLNVIARPGECEKIKAKVRGNWIVQCDITCPKCLHEHDLMDMDEWYELSKPGETKDFSDPVEYKCEACGFEMELTGTDY